MTNSPLFSSTFRVLWILSSKTTFLLPYTYTFAKFSDSNGSDSFNIFPVSSTSYYFLSILILFIVFLLTFLKLGIFSLLIFLNWLTSIQALPRTSSVLPNDLFACFFILKLFTISNASLELKTLTNFNDSNYLNTTWFFFCKSFLWSNFPSILSKSIHKKLMV